MGDKSSSQRRQKPSPRYTEAQPWPSRQDGTQSGSVRTRAGTAHCSIPKASTLVWLSAANINHLGNLFAESASTWPAESLATLFKTLPTLLSGAEPDRSTTAFGLTVSGSMALCLVVELAVATAIQNSRLVGRSVPGMETASSLPEA